MICIITSVLQPSFRPLAYAPRRSRYSVQQRFEQLTQSIQSLRKHLPEANSILIVEGSRSLSSEWTEKLSSLSFEYNTNILFANSPLVDSPWKAQGEAFLLIKGLEWVKQNNLDHPPVFKLSGRYRLSQEFNKEEFLKTTNKNVFREIEKGSVFWETKPCFYTFFYKIHDLNRLYILCERILGEKGKESIEVYFYREFFKDAVLVHHLGVEGNISHSGRFIQK